MEFISYSTKGNPSCRVFKISGENSSHSLNHNTRVTLQFIQQGEGKYFINDHCVDFCRNSVLVSMPGDNQRCIPNPGCFMDKLCLRFPPQSLKSYCPKNIYRMLPPVLCLDEKSVTKVRLLMQAICDDIQNKSFFWKYHLRCNISSLLIYLYRFNHKQSDKVQPHPVVKNAINIIEKEYRSVINIPSIACQLHVSCSRLSHVFRTATGMGLRQYIIQRKIAEAKLLLGSGQNKIEVIAGLLGYQNPRSFLRQFKQSTLLTPTEYRCMLINDKTAAK